MAKKPKPPPTKYWAYTIAYENGVTAVRAHSGSIASLFIRCHNEKRAPLLVMELEEDEYLALASELEEE